MTLLARPVASYLKGTTIGVFGAAATTLGGRGRDTTVFVGVLTAAPLPSPTSTYSFTTACTFPVGTATGPFSLATFAAAGKHSMAGMAALNPFSLLPGSR